MCTKEIINTTSKKEVIEVPKKIVKFTNSVDVRILKDMKNGLDDLIELIEQFKD